MILTQDAFEFKHHMLILYGVTEVWEVSRSLPGARGFVLIDYQPAAANLDLIQTPNYQDLCAQKMRPPPEYQCVSS